MLLYKKHYLFFIFLNFLLSINGYDVKKIITDCFQEDKIDSGENERYIAQVVKIIETDSCKNKETYRFIYHLIMNSIKNKEELFSKEEELRQTALERIKERKRKNNTRKQEHRKKQRHEKLISKTNPKLQEMAQLLLA